MNYRISVVTNRSEVYFCGVFYTVMNFTYIITLPSLPSVSHQILICVIHIKINLDMVEFISILLHCLIFFICVIFSLLPIDIN